MDDRLKANLDAWKWNMMAGIHAASREYRWPSSHRSDSHYLFDQGDQALN
jgi:hypothetical protein